MTIEQILEDNDDVDHVRFTITVRLSLRGIGRKIILNISSLTGTYDALCGHK